jgi:hypothetical protein
MLEGGKVLGCFNGLAETFITLRFLIRQQIKKSLKMKKNDYTLYVE